MVKRLRRAWPKVKIIFRGDSGFCRWRMLRWCETHGVFYLAGLAKNSRLNERAGPFLEQAQKATKPPARSNGSSAKSGMPR